MNSALQTRPYIFLVLAVLLTGFCYYPGLAGDYMFDDSINLLENARLDIESIDLDSLLSAAFSSGAGPLRRPLSMLSFALNRYYFGVDPYSYKVINLVIHLVTGIGLYYLTRLLILSYRDLKNPGLSSAAVRWLPVVVATLWLVHPLNLTSVLYIVQRMTSLAALFTVLGLSLYVIGRRRIMTGNSGMPLILAGLVVFGGLAVLSKESGALLPLFMFVVELSLFNFRGSQGSLYRPVIYYYLIVILLPVSFAIVYYLTNPDAINYSNRDFSLSERLLTEARVVVFYLKMIIMPSITELGLHHDDIRISRGIFQPYTTVLSLLVLCGLLVAAFMLIKKLPLVGLGILWFFTGHALESTVLPLEIAHEHRNYLADYGILLSAVCLIAASPKYPYVRILQTAALFTFLLLFAATTWLRATQWSDPVVHAIHEARHHPESARAAVEAGRVFALMAADGDLDKIDMAYAYLEKASRLDRTGILPEMIMVKLSYMLERPVKTEWFDRMYYKLENHPITAGDLNSLRNLSDCIDDICKIPHEVMERLLQLALKSESGQILTIYAYYKIRKRGDLTQGLALLNRAVETYPHETQHWINLIDLLISLNRLGDAEQALARFKANTSRPGASVHYRRLDDAIKEKRKSADTLLRPEKGSSANKHGPQRSDP